MIKIIDNTAELSKTIFDNAKEKVKNLKEYYENTKLIAEQLERAATAMEKISKYQDLAINIKNNGNTNIIDKSKKIDKYILSPNNYIKDVRMYLNKLGYYIEDEKLIKDKYIYTVIVFKIAEGIFAYILHIIRN